MILSEFSDLIGKLRCGIEFNGIRVRVLKRGFIVRWKLGDLGIWVLKLGVSVFG